MEKNLAWMTTSRIKPGTLADFKRTWRPERHPDGLLHASTCLTGRLEHERP